MANYFYVVNTGTLSATSDTPYSSQQTGSFPANSNCYASIADAFSSGKTNPPTHGDFVCVSDTHSSAVHESDQTCSAPTGDGAGVILLSVDNTACHKYKRGAVEQTSTGTFDFILNGNMVVAGLDFFPGDDLRSTTTGSEIIFYDCSATVAGSLDMVFRGSTGCITHFINCTFNINDTDAMSMSVGSDSLLRCINCTWETTVSWGSNKNIVEFGGSASTSVEFIGCNISNVGVSALLWDVNINTLVKTLTARNCKLHANTIPIKSGTKPGGLGISVLVANSADTSSAAEYQYFYIDGLGQVEENTGVYRDASTAFPAGQKISLRVDSDANASKARPFAFEFPTRYSALSSTSTDNITIYITCASTLNNDEVYAEVLYPDGTNKHTPNVEESIGQHLVHGDFRTTTPVALTTNTEAWTGGLTYKYQLDIDTSTDAGADCVPVIRVYVAKASTTIYFCPTIGLS